MATVHFTQNLARHTPCPSRELAADSVAELLQRYFADWPGVRGYVLDDQGGVRHHVKIIVDGRNLRDRRALSDALTSTSEVHIFQALSGG